MAILNGESATERASIMSSTTPQSNQLTDAAIADQLLAALRQLSGDSNLDYTETPQRLTGGYETLTYGFQLSAESGELSGPLILRLFNNPGDTDQSRRESAFQNSLADLGYPVPRVVAQFDDGIANRPFNVMERIEGAPMMDEASLDPENIGRVIDWLATVHTRLHQIPSAPVIEAVEKAGFSLARFSLDGRLRYMQRYFEGDTFDALRPGFDWLIANRPAERESPSVCHGDFHPGNIMVKDGEVTGVIDWPGAAFADPEFDVGSSVVLLKVGAAMIDPAAVPFAQQMVSMYLKRYNELSPLDMGKLDYYEALRNFRAFIRGTALRTPGVDPELAPRDQYPWASEFATHALQARLAEITGINLPLPAGV